MLTKCEYENKLAGLGCQVIGNGLYANVFSVPHRSDLAIKVAGCDPWPDYIRWATKAGYAGKFAPKVYSLKFHSDYYVAIMERLVCTVREIRFTDKGDYRDIRTDQLTLYNQFSGYGRGEKDETAAPDFIAYVAQLRHHQFYGDMHDGNVMVRHDGQLVITDPVSGGSSEYFRIKKGVCL